MAGSRRTIASSRRRSGHRIAVMTAPSAASLNRPLPKLAAACLPKMRLRPEPGEILLNLGLSCSPDHTRRCCIMLPAIAASTSNRRGTPTAAITVYSRLLASCNSAGPSVRIIQELAIKLRSGGMMPPPIEPEKVDITSVPPAITNQVLISWLLTTSPRSSASSRRFCVGSSVFSVSSSSAMFPSMHRHHVMHHADEIIEEGAHHRGDDERKDQKAGEDRKWHADEIDLHLRHQPRQHAKSDVEDEAEHQKRRGELQADAKRGTEGARRQG